MREGQRHFWILCQTHYFVAGLSDQDCWILSGWNLRSAIFKFIVQLYFCISSHLIFLKIKLVECEPGFKKRKRTSCEPEQKNLRERTERIEKFIKELEIGNSKKCEPEQTHESCNWTSWEVHNARYVNRTPEFLYRKYTFILWRWNQICYLKYCPSLGIQFLRVTDNLCMLCKKSYF